MTMIRILMFTPFNFEKLQSLKSTGNSSTKENIIKKEKFSEEVTPKKKKNK